jgi:hypothetical protein
MWRIMKTSGVARWASLAVTCGSQLFPPIRAALFTREVRYPRNAELKNHLWQVINLDILKDARQKVILVANSAKRSP